MPEVDEPNHPARKIKALRQIQLLLDQVGRFRARDSGLTEDEFAELANEELIEVTFDRDEGPTLERYHIEKVLPKGSLILAQSALAAPSPLQVSISIPAKSVCQRIFEGTRSGLWDLIKIAFGAVLGAILTKYFGK